MPAVETDENRRASKLLPALFWAGAGLAALAGLLLLLGSGDTPLRVAAALAVLAVVLIGLSVALRPDAEAVRLEMEETLLDEIDMLREDVREDIANAARATHQNFGERLQVLQSSVDGVRGELDAVRGGLSVAAGAAGVGGAAVRPPVAEPMAAPPPVAARAAAGVRSGVTPTPVSPPRSAPPGPVYGGAGLPEPREERGRESTREYGRDSGRDYGGREYGRGREADRDGGRDKGRDGGRQADRDSGREYGRGTPVRSAPPEPGRAPMSPVSSVPGGIFQHTETVQVTTRSSTFVDRNGDPDRPRSYGQGFRRGDTDTFSRRDGGFRRGETDHGDDRRSWSAPPARPDDPAEESWTDKQLRERYGRRSLDLGRDRGAEEDREDSWRDRSGRRGRAERPALESGTSGGRRRAAEPEWLEQGDEDYEPFPGVRTGDRYAEVRSDDRGRELRLGERRTSMRADDTGTELRYEDRWAAVRRSENGRPEAGRPDGARSDAGRPDYGRRALPATSSEPSWNEAWDEPVREPRSRRRRGADDLQDLSYPATGSQRRIDYELSDERWR